jgi:hypothetical protein
VEGPPKRKGGRPEYYAYVSDQKVDMLRSSIPPKVSERLALELKLDLKVLSLSLGNRPAPEDRYSLARLVSEYLRDQGLVGTLEEPNEYFEGTMLMSWGPYGWRRDSTLLFFTGEMDGLYVGLGGSMKHAIGLGPSDGSYSDSGIAGMIEHFMSDDEVRRELNVSSLQEFQGGVDWDKFVGVAIKSAHEMAYFKAPPERMTFLARTLRKTLNPSHPARGLLGSPIYVAFATADS